MNFFEKNKDIGLLIARLGVGIPFVFIYGLPKLKAGPEMWKGLGGAMKNLGITWYPEFWGFFSMSAEFFCAILLILGLFTRPVAFIMAFNMFVAMVNHFARLDMWGRVGTPMQLMFVFLALVFLGPGKYSLDRWWSSRKKPEVQEPSA